MLNGIGLLMQALGRYILQAMGNLFLGIAAVFRVSSYSRQHGNNPVAFLAPAAGLDSFFPFVCCVAGDLMALEFRIVLNQDFLDQKL